MAQYDVHRNATPSVKLYPYLVIVQSGLLRRWNRYIVVPLAVTPSSSMDAVTTPDVEIDGRRAVFLPQLITNVQKSALGPLVGNLANHGDALIRALDQVLARGYPD